MPITIRPYNTARFNASPCLSDALMKHQVAGGNDWVHDTFGDLFRRHRVDSMLGICLLHHHFSLEDGEFLTEVGGTSTAWKSQTGSRPSVWCLDVVQKGLLPFEFSMDGDQEQVAYPDWTSEMLQSFLTELFDLVDKLGVTGIYGLARYPGDDFPGRVEMTIGRANVNLTPTQATRYDPGQQSEAAWFFKDGFRQRGCRCNCYHHGGQPGSGSHNHAPTVTE